MEISENFKKYLSGFFDGDGSITVEKLNTSSYTLRIKFYQANEDWINTIQRYYPFLKKSNNQQRKDNTRIQYELRAAGKQIEPLVDDLLKYSILKYEQLLEAKKFFDLINVKDKSNEKETIYNKLKELKKESKIKPYERLSKEYISGLFDAEGSIGIYNNSLRVKITQKSDVIILQKIADLYNNTNKIDNYAISFYGENSLQILNEINPYCIYKTQQIDAAINYIKTLNTELSDDIRIKREEYQQIILNEKHIDINLNNVLFKNQESHKVYVVNALKNFEKLSYNEVLSYCKMKEIEETKVFSKFENKIYNIDEWQKFNINPVLEFCETNNQLQIYQYYRKKVSSLPLTGVIGRAIRILVRDSITDNYIGIMCLSSDVYNLGERDFYIKNTCGIIDLDRNTTLKNVMNLSCCVPLQPFGFNTTGGKLLASLAFSREIFEYYSSKYNDNLLGIITTSINGKSIQYDRLDCLKMIGYTKGYGSVNIPSELYLICQDYNNIWKVIPKTNRVDRFTFLKNLLNHLDLPQKMLQHNNKRGIYFGYLFSSKLNKNYNLNELKSVNEIYNNWKLKWCNKRINNLIQRDNIKIACDLYTIDSFKDCVKYELPKIQEKVITDNLIKEILTYKSKPNSQDEVCKILNKKYNMELLKSDISRIYTGNILPKIQDEEYMSLICIKSSKKKISDEQIYFILNYHKNQRNFIKDKPPSYSVIVEKFKNKFNKEITKGTVSDIICNKVKPDVTLPQKISPKKEITPSDKFKLLDNQQLLTIIKMKCENKTTQEVSNYIKENFNIYINRNFISQLWNGENIGISEVILNSTEYQDMIQNTKQRNVKSKKFTKDELEWVLSNNLDKSLSQRVDLFKEQFNKTISKTYLSKF